jgi:hypothetical protein
VGFEAPEGVMAVGGTVGEVELVEASGRVVPVPGGGAGGSGPEHGGELVVLVVCGSGPSLAVGVEPLVDAVEFEVQPGQLCDVAAVEFVLVGHLGDAPVEAIEFGLASPDLVGSGAQRRLGVGDGGVVAAPPKGPVVVLEGLGGALEDGPGVGEAASDVAALHEEPLEIGGEVGPRADAVKRVEEGPLPFEPSSKLGGGEHGARSARAGVGESVAAGDRRLVDPGPGEGLGEQFGCGVLAGGDDVDVVGAPASGGGDVEAEKKGPSCRLSGSPSTSPAGQVGSVAAE